MRKLLFECNHRLAGMRGPRAFELIAALIFRWPQVQSGILFIGDCCEGGRHRSGSDNCCMARLMSRCGRTAHRAKADVERVGLIRLHRTTGGKILDAKGHLRGAATGYELDPAFAEPRPPRPEPGTPADHPAARVARQQGWQKIQASLDAMRSRAGP